MSIAAKVIALGERKAWVIPADFLQIKNVNTIPATSLRKISTVSFAIAPYMTGIVRGII